MFGVLVVATQTGSIGYLSGYSGELQAELESLAFVPPVYQLPKGEDFPEMAAINAIGQEIKSLEKSDEYDLLKTQLERIRKEVEENIRVARVAAKQAKAERYLKRKNATQLLEQERKQLLEELSRQSIDSGYALKRFSRSERLRLEKVTEATRKFEQRIEQLKALRKSKSAELQEAIFRAYVFQNGLGESKDVKTVFTDFGVDVPPAGAGECAAPKLFQYAFQKQLKPIALAEFWWGPSPNSEIREQGKFYPACKRKCQPILAFMLKGIPVKPNPLLENFGKGKELEVLYKDEHLVVVNKPSGLLSVPGNHITDSVQVRLQKRFPEATGPMIVHRLDQDTSGVMIVTLTKAAHKRLQQQFAERTVDKIYVATLEKTIVETSGVIDLPLILDINNRPMQKVDFEWGKPATTNYKVLQKSATQTLIQLSPVTGRSHQLRVHCAHKLGLHAPIAGDNLYGSPSDRLCLHAQQIAFSHPFTNKVVTVKTDLPFSI